MNKKERVESALRGNPVDRVPVSVWSHPPKGDRNIQTVMESLVDSFIHYDWDFLKVHPRSTCFAEAWKARYRPADQPDQPPVFEGGPVLSATDWKRLRVLEPNRGPLLDQLRLLQLLNHQVGYDAYFIQTIPCPLGVACSLVGGKTASVLHTLREDRSALHNGLRTMTETLINYTIASLEQGAGICYSTCGWASEGALTQDQYREFGEQYDLEFLDAVKSRSKITILHNSGERIYFDLLGSYPVHAINWDVFALGNPSLAEGKKRSGKAAMGGLNPETITTGSPNQIQDEIAHLLVDAGPEHLLLAPGRIIPLGAPIQNLEAIQHALS